MASGEINGNAGFEVANSPLPTKLAMNDRFRPGSITSNSPAGREALMAGLTGATGGGNICSILSHVGVGASIGAVGMADFVGFRSASQ